MRYLLICSLLLSLAACVDEVTFVKPEETERYLVVEGLLLAGDATQEIKLTRSDVLGRSVFDPVPNAVVRLHGPGGAAWLYENIGEGLYRIPDGVVTIQSGSTYYITIGLNGQEYRSEPERIPPLQVISSADFAIAGEDLQLRVQNVLPEEHDVFFKWDVINLFALSEILCNPLQTTKTCYVDVPFNPQDLRILDATRLEAGATVEVIIGEVHIGEQFGNPNSFLITQTSLTREALDYYAQIDIVSNQLGSIFDAQPAIVRGNVHNQNDPDEIVLGFMAGAAQDTAVVFTYAGDFVPEFQVLPHCGIPGFRPFPFRPECCNCLRFDNATAVKPDYWP